MHELLFKMEPGQLIGLVAVAGGLVCGIVAIVMGVGLEITAWNSRPPSKDMLERGMTADDPDRHGSGIENPGGALQGPRGRGGVRSPHGHRGDRQIVDRREDRRSPGPGMPLVFGPSIGPADARGRPQQPALLPVANRRAAQLDHPARQEHGPLLGPRLLPGLVPDMRMPFSSHVSTRAWRASMGRHPVPERKTRTSRKQPAASAITRSRSASDMISCRRSTAGRWSLPLSGFLAIQSLRAQQFRHASMRAIKSWTVFGFQSRPVKAAST